MDNITPLQFTPGEINESRTDLIWFLTFFPCDFPVNQSCRTATLSHRGLKRGRSCGHVPSIRTKEWRVLTLLLLKEKKFAVVQWWVTSTDLLTQRHSWAHKLVTARHIYFVHAKKNPKLQIYLHIKLLYTFI